MRKGIIVCSAVAVLAGGTVAQAKDVRPYFSLEVGAAVNADGKGDSGDPAVSYDPGLAAGGAIGLDFEAGRIEAEVAYRRSGISEIGGVSINGSGKLQVLSYMVNGYLTAPVQSALKPYLLGGVGFATGFLSSVGGSTSATSTQFAYQGGAGIGFDIKRNVTLDASYRYLGTSDFSFNGDKLSYGSHNMLFGVRYTY